MKKRRDRIEKLVELVTQADTLHLKEAARRLDVSEMTLRRDISVTESSPVNLLGGYLVLSGEQKRPLHYLISDQQQRNIAEKQYIGKLGADLIEDNDMVFFDCGTTTPYIIANIDNQLNFSAVCYSLNVFLALQQKKGCNVILCGGEFMATNAIFTPVNQHSPLDVICPSKTFISAAGITTKAVTCFNLQEVNWKTKAMARSHLNILIADSSKFDNKLPAYIGALTDFDLLISDNVPDNYESYCQKHHVNVLT